MAINIELTWDESVTVGEVEEFIAQAKSAGVDSTTVIEEITHDQDPSLQLGWRVAAQGVPRPVRDVAMPHRLMWNLHSLLEQIASGDGDVRALQSEVMSLDADLWNALMKHVGDE
ncbi:hypothetical protein ACFXPT_09180 [Streptomyces goshikiensis]|uniref:hypothetical protein n=1 Tax=Streptomyces goshikiensis TaxID=1942 RepID=UPI0036C31EDC